VGKYSPKRGSHAPGDPREAFCDWVGSRSQDPEYKPEYRDGRRPVRWIMGQLWNCTDTLPEYECRALGVAVGSSYAQAVRAVFGSCKSPG